MLPSHAAASGTGQPSSQGLPTRAEINGWVVAIDGLSSSAVSFRDSAEQMDQATDHHVRQLSAPGGAGWDGDAADAARGVAYSDRGVVYEAADRMRSAAKIADQGAQSLNAARDRVLEAIAEAEHDDFAVSDDLTVTDRRSYSKLEMQALASRTTAAETYRGVIAMRASALMAEDAVTGSKLQDTAATLHAMVPTNWIPPNGRSANLIQATDFRTAPQSPLFDSLSVHTAEDVHRIVDPLPPGRQPGVKTLPTAEAINGLYGQLTENSAPGPVSTYPGQWRVLEDGTKVGLRPNSKFGGPTVEVWYPDGTKNDVHLAERPKLPEPAPAPVPVPVPVPVPLPVPEMGSQRVVTPEEGGIIAVLGGIGIGILAGVGELGKIVFSP